MATYDEALQLARQRLGAGDLAQAESIYRRLIEAAPQGVAAWHELGLVLLQSWRTEQAVEPLRQAVALAPSESAYSINLAVAYRLLGRAVEALAMFERALQLAPPTAELLNNVALSLKDTGQGDAALRAFDRALSLRPDYANGHFNRGNLLLELERFAEAADSYRRAVELCPGDAVAHCKLGMAHCELGRMRDLKLASDLDTDTVLTKQRELERAAACFRRALELEPDYSEAYGNLAIALVEQSNIVEAAAERRLLDRQLLETGVADSLSEAASCWRRALALRPEQPEGLGSLGVVLEKQGALDEAADCWRRALELQPDFADAHNNLGALLSKQGRSDEAIACWRRALELKPDFAEASGNLGIALAQQGRSDEARECYRTALALHPDQVVWRLNLISLCPTIFQSDEQIAEYRRALLVDLETLANSKPKLDLSALAAGACAPSFNLQFHGYDERPTREAYARLFRDCVPSGESPRHGKGRPRIGFVVTDQHESLFVKSLGGVLERMNHDLFELVVIGSDRGIGTLRDAIANPAIRYVPVANRLQPFVAAIRDAQLDLLYYWEVGTDSINYFLPFHRLAPVQCTSWGIQVTSGIPQLDYYLSSKLIETDEARKHYSETLVLADTLLTYQKRLQLPAGAKPREAFGFGRDRHLYVCAQQLGKFQPDFDSVLAGILRRDAQGVVVATHDRRGTLMADELRRRWLATMPDVADRIVLVPFQAPEDYLALLAAADVLLDPLHFGGVNSSYDGFSLNQPIVTLPSAYQRGRYALACYQKMGIPQCVARDADHYVDLAVALATDASFRAEIVEKIRAASHVLFEDSQAVSEHERMFGELIERSRSDARAKF